MAESFDIIMDKTYYNDTKNRKSERNCEPGQKMVEVGCELGEKPV